MKKTNYRDDVDFKIHRAKIESKLLVIDGEVWFPGEVEKTILFEGEVNFPDVAHWSFVDPHHELLINNERLSEIMREMRVLAERNQEILEFLAEPLA